MKIYLGLIPFFLLLSGFAESASPEQLVRRLYIDLFERLPSNSELVSASRQISEDKYEKLVDSMLSDLEFKQTLAHKITLHYSPNLSGKRNTAGEVDPKYFKRFIRMRKLVEKKYLDKGDFRYFIQDLTAGRGIATAKPALYFYDQQESLEELTGRFADRVLGVPLKCAQCHNHREHKDLYQIDFWGLAAFFKNTQIMELKSHGDVTGIPSKNKFNIRTYSSLMDHEDYRPLKNWYRSELRREFIFEGDPLEFDTPDKKQQRGRHVKLKVNQLLILENKANLKFLKLENPDDSKEKFEPLLIGQSKVPFKTLKPRTYLAQWLISPENPFLKKAVTNWVSNWIFGRGFKMPLTDIYGKGLNDEMLSEYSEFLLKNKFNLNLLIRKMLLSEHYRRSSAKEFNMANIQQFKERALRQVPAKVFMKMATKKEETVKEDFDNAITDQAELISYFPINEDNCDNSFKGSVSQSLFLTFNDRLRARIINSLPQGLADQTLVKDLVVKFYSRKASAKEVELLTKALQGKKGQDRVTALNDVLWVLINSPEMRFY